MGDVVGRDALWGLTRAWPQGEKGRAVGRNVTYSGPKRDVQWAKRLRNHG